MFFLNKKIDYSKLPNHIAIIMDGNGRWANKRGLKRNVGHYHGGMNIAKITKLCDEIGIKHLTLFAFSTENWKRPKEEVEYLMNEPLKIIRNNYDKIVNSNIRINFIGRRDRLGSEQLFLIEDLIFKTRNNEGLNLIIAFDYGSRNDIVNAINNIIKDKLIKVDEEDIKKYLSTSKYPDIDLLIRTSGELRISNFLLYELAYSELYFTKTYWPSFNKKELFKAINNYQKRNRRFGGLK